MKLRLGAALCGVSLLFAFSSIAHAQSGMASIYSGGRTANGERAAAGGLTAAHRTLPFGTQVRQPARHLARDALIGAVEFDWFGSRFGHVTWL